MSVLYQGDVHWNRLTVDGLWFNELGSLMKGLVCRLFESEGLYGKYSNLMSVLYQGDAHWNRQTDDGLKYIESSI